jgi:hypothetical protein
VKPDLFFIADAARVDDQGKVEVRGGGIGHIVLPHLPAGVPQLAVLVRWLIEELDVGRERLISIALSDPNGVEIEKLEGTLPPPASAQAHEGEPATMTAVGTFIAPTFAEYGVHRVLVLLDEEPSAEGSFAVLPGATAPGDASAQSVQGG